MYIVIGSDNMLDILNSRRNEAHDIYYEYPGDDRTKDIKGRLYIMPPYPERGIRCGYSLFIPEECETDTTLLVHCCNTGGATIKDEELDKSNVAIHLFEGNKAAKMSAIELNPEMWYGSDLKIPVVTPLIPRVRGYYTQALGSMVYKNDVSYLEEDNSKREGDTIITPEEIKQIQEQCRDLPLQVANIIIESMLLLRRLGINVDSKVIMEGYSAGSKFANGFTALHPELVKACICGGNSGLGIMPIEKLGGEKLEFPLGVANIPNFNKELFLSIPQYYYIGNEDYNDPALTDSDKLDKKGQLHPKYKENYTPQEITIIHTMLGTNPQERFDNNEKMYKLFGINAKFERLAGNHDTVTKQRDDDGNFIVAEHIEEFIKDILEKEKKDTKQMGFAKTIVLELVSLIGITIIILGIILIK